MQHIAGAGRSPLQSWFTALFAGFALSGAIAVSLGAQQAQQGTGSDAEPPSADWHGFVGVGGATLGSYYGGDARRELPFPLFRAEYRNRVYLGASETGLGGGLGVYLRRGRVDWSVHLAGSETRRERLADVLAGMRDRKESMFGGTSVTMRYGIASAGASIAGALGHRAGVQGTAGITVGGAFASRWSGALSGSATVADRRNMAYDFGISATEAARRHALVAAGDRRLTASEAAQFAPRGGVKDVRSSAQLGYAIAPRWQAVSVVSASWLQGDAAASPLARKRSALTAALGAAWRF